MPNVTGSVKKIIVDQTTCKVVVDVTPGGVTPMLLWSYAQQEDNATNRLTHGTYLALTRDAYLNGKNVSYYHEAGSALVGSVTIEDP